MIPGPWSVQLVLSGQENMEIDGVQYSLWPGDIIIWDSTREMKFEVTERLHKISLIATLKRVKEWVPVPDPKSVK